ncbi:23S rRNA (guanosine(2251)-2'-O)-methyltransferase RlmB [Alienimonas californiensis]|uniref:23S rRNA (Guanosine-2'-O-)-methyltransferase RlmB n=1 Tax=Alienimonas californiensis TaxID=2527989 RepID=A0A517PFM6_9PLAN|nr:RNA methyltransferase [Alienimonas californiensis]QDT18165.1 23S rRNA (guanosine-2'-O-)-methyltransferase RlmB [Alienimonas californiensis]
MSLSLRNPHSVLAALRLRPGSVTSVSPPAGRPSPAWAAVLDAAYEAGVPLVDAAPRSGGGRRQRRGGPPDRDARGGGGEANVAPKPAVSLGQLFAGVKQNEPGLWLALDRIQDVHNLGAIFRSAAFFGVRGVVFTRDQSAPLTAAAYDVACGGVEAVPHAAPTNLAAALSNAKDAGLWTLGTSEHAGILGEAASTPSGSAFDVDRDRPWLVVIGGEEKGLRRRTLDLCDEVCQLPPGPGNVGPVTSLNAAVACGAILAALSRPLPEKPPA